jgi:hypothetical protein
MPHLRRRTTAMLAAFIGISQTAAAFAFVWYRLAAIEAGSFPREGVLVQEPGSSSFSTTWGYVYLSTVAAWLLLSIFAARGQKFWCLLAGAALTALSWPIAVIAGALLGA